MAKYPKYKYEFQLGDETFFLAVGESKVNANGDVVKVERYSDNGGLMKHLSISTNGGVWFPLEKGQRVAGGIVRDDFRRFEVCYPAAYPNGFKVRETYDKTNRKK